MTAPNVGAAAGCDLLMLVFKKPEQKIAAFGSSYRGGSGLPVNPVECAAHCQFGEHDDLLNRQRRVHQWRTVGCQGGISGRPAPTGIACCLQEMGWLAGAIASRLTPTGGSGTSVGDWSAVRPPSLASQAPTGIVCGLKEMGRLSGRLREQALLLQKAQARSKDRSLRQLLHRMSASSTKLLILIHERRRKAEWRD